MKEDILIQLKVKKKYAYVKLVFSEIQITSIWSFIHDDWGANMHLMLVIDIKPDRDGLWLAVQCWKQIAKHGLANNAYIS